jgi:hypothetical protein
MMNEETKSETSASLKTAQPFMAGFTVVTKSKVPQGRQNGSFVPAGTWKILRHESQR